MLKKFISYLIIFSILYPDVAHCGSISGKATPENSDDEQNSHYVPVKRNTAAAHGPTETTHLFHSERQDPDPMGISYFSTSYNFTAYNESSQAQSLPFWTRTREGELSDRDEPITSEGGLIVLSEGRSEEITSRAVYPDNSSKDLDFTDIPDLSAGSLDFDRIATDRQHKRAGLFALPQDLSQNDEENSSDSGPLIFDKESLDDVHFSVESDNSPPQEAGLIPSDNTFHSIDIPEGRTETTLVEKSSPNSGSSEDSDEALITAGGLLLDEESDKDEAEVQGEPTKSMDQAVWERVPRKRPSSQDHRSSFQEDADSINGLQWFFENLLSSNRVESQTPRRPHSLVINQGSDQKSTSAQELGDFFFVSGNLSEVLEDEFPNLSPESRAFLRYVKKRVVDGEPNKKQIAGIFAGIVMGAGVAWPWMCIMFDSLLKFYGTSIQFNANNGSIEPDILIKKLQDFNAYININSMTGLVGIPMGVHTASQTASILSNLATDDTHSFMLQRSKKHEWTLLGVKGCAYLGSIFSGLLPVYYLYNSLLRGALTTTTFFNDTTSTGCISYDIFLNISSYILPYYQACLQDPYYHSEKLPLFQIGGTFLFFNAFLRYGHQLSKSATQWIDNYFFDKIRKNSPFSPPEVTRQKHLTQFKNLSHMIWGSSKNELEHFYNSIFNHTADNSVTNSENFTIYEAIRVLRVCKEFHEQQLPLEDEDSSPWKKVWASRLGSTIPFIATMGRMVVFQYAIQQLLGAFWQDEYGDLSDGATILSSILAFSLAHVSQGLMEKEAVKESVYEILGGKKLGAARSHRALRVGVKIWDYVHGSFSTLPYLVVGLAAPLTFYNDSQDVNVYSLSVFSLLFLFSFSIADVFNSTIAFHHSHFNLINTFDSAKSYYSPSEDYKRDKLVRMIYQLSNLWKELHPSVLKEVTQQLAEGQGERKPDVIFFQPVALTSLEVPCLSSRQSRINYTNKEIGDGVEDVILVSKLLPEVQESLRYVKIRLVDGLLNWKQKMSIMGGLITGAAVAWPMMLIIFDGLLTPAFQYLHKKDHVQDEASLLLLKESLKNYNSFVNFKTMMALIGIPMGIDAASRTTAIFIDYTKDNTGSFSIQKNKSHTWALLAAKGAIYLGACASGFLPVYYLYESIIGCNHLLLSDDNTTMYVSSDIYLNITSNINSTNWGKLLYCNITKSDLDPQNFPFFKATAPFLFLDIVLQYGHQLSHQAEQWINNYFFSQMRESSHFSFIATIRKGYLAQFKNLNHTIRELDERAIDHLYRDIFVTNGRKTTHHPELSDEDSTINEAIRALKIFKKLSPPPTMPTTNETSKDWKKIWSSRIGRAVPLVATFGRMMIFQYIIRESFGEFKFEGVGADIISAILGAVFANIAQGFIEKDAVQKGVYEILGGKEFSDEQSHSPLRAGIKVWNYVYGALHTLPYLSIGKSASESSFSDAIYEFSLSPWQYPLLISFGLADAFNNAIAFHDSNLGVVNAYDSLKATYGTPSPEYKRDKLVRVVRQLRKLFKELDHPVLQQVDQLLNQDDQLASPPRPVSDSLFAGEEESL